MSVITKKLADAGTDVAREQLRVSGLFKQPRMETIKMNEDYALGIVTPDLDIPFNDTYPVMSGYVADLMSKIDDAPDLSFAPHGKADFLLTEKIQAAFAREIKSKKVNAKWRLKDRWWKKNAIYSGRGIAKLWTATPEGRFMANLNVVSHYDFHCEPDGGGDLGNHLFQGQEAVFKTKEELLIGARTGWYDPEQVGKLVNNYSDDDYKDNEDDYQNRANRSRALNLDVGTNNYTGQTLFKLVEWYFTWRGEQWYVLFEDVTYTWVRFKKLSDIFATNENPYVSWSTEEDPDVFWNLAPCDPVRVLQKATDRFLNQESYNREKQNKGQKAYDADMFLDAEALDDPSVDTLIPAKVPVGKTVTGGIHEFTVPGLGGTLNMIDFLNQFVRSNTAAGPGGVSDKNKKVGVYYGELEQANQIIGTKNKSYTEAQEELGMKYAQGLYENLDTKGLDIQLMGASGIEWNRLTRYELRKRGSLNLDISVSGGSEEEELKEVDRQKKKEGLAGVSTVNPQWRDKQILKQSGFSEEEIKEAFSTETTSTKKLIAQAYEAIEDIENGRKARFNRDATAGFMQTIIDYAKSVDISEELFNKLVDYAISHAEIAGKNTIREARQALNEMGSQREQIEMNQAGKTTQPQRASGSPQSGVGKAISIGLQASNELRQ